MRLAVVGVGQMGKAVQRRASAAGHEIGLTASGRNARVQKELSPERLAGIDVAIEFTGAESVLGNVECVTAAGVPIVVGTTGWDTSMEEARAIVEARGTGLVYGANFSIGAQVLFTLAREAARLFERFGGYDPYVLEHHHRGKMDAPSGTALRVARTIADNMARKIHVHAGNPENTIGSDAIHIASLRAGSAFGHHRVGFDSATDQLEIVHTARSRDGFACGALHAAEWVIGRSGTYEFAEILDL